MITHKKETKHHYIIRVMATLPPLFLYDFHLDLVKPQPLLLEPEIH